MTLSSLPIDEITYQDLLTFCEEKHKEDIDLNYKSDFPNDLARLLSAFANTQGGTVLIGIKERGKSREPICPPEGIIGPQDVIGQRILNIAFDSIYPPVEPENSVIQIPDTERFVALIRVAATRAIHAVERRSRIYIRSFDNNRGYELASLPDLRWLWDQRESSILLRDQFLKRASERANGTAIKFGDDTSRSEWESSPHLIVSCIPAYPQKPVVLSTRKLLEIADSLPQVRSPWGSVDRKVPWTLNHWRTIPSAVCLSERGSSGFSQYVEIGVFGHMYFDFLISRRAVNTLLVPKPTNESRIFAYIVLSYIDVALRYSSSFLNNIHFRWPLVVSSELQGVRNLLLQYERPASRNLLAQEFLSRPSTDNSMVLLRKEINAEVLEDSYKAYVYESAQALLWAFGVGWQESDIANWLGHETS